MKKKLAFFDSSIQEFNINIQKPKANNTILIIESNTYHGETLPSIAYYFMSLGYHVELLVQHTLWDKDPFYLYGDNKPDTRIFNSTEELLLYLFQTKFSGYKAIFANSNRIGTPKSIILDNELY